MPTRSAAEHNPNHPPYHPKQMDTSNPFPAGVAHKSQRIVAVITKLSLHKARNVTQRERSTLLVHTINDLGG